MTRDGLVKAVNGITFALERGKVLTILGESGSGKSVTLRSLVRLLPKVRTRLSGEVTLKGMNLYELSEGEVQNLRGSLVAMIFQEPMTALDPVYTVGKQIVETLVRHQHVTYPSLKGLGLQLAYTTQRVALFDALPYRRYPPALGRVTVARLCQDVLA